MKPKTKEQREIINQRAREKTARLTAEQRAILARKKRERYFKLDQTRKEIISTKRKEYYNKNKERMTALDRSYSIGYKQRRKDLNCKWRRQNSEHLKQYMHLRYQNMSDTQKITKRIRNRLYNFLKMNSFKKQKHSVEYLGCSWDTFEIYWKGKIEAWNTVYPDNKISIETAAIDHIRPISIFKEDSLTWGNHFTNLQPLPSYVNQRKNAKWQEIDENFWFANIIFNPTYLAPYLPVQMRDEFYSKALCHELPHNTSVNKALS